MVRTKIVPPARDAAFLLSVSDALPRVPGSVEDCCSRIRDRTDVPSRDVAREYLTFCEALGLAAATDGEYYRPRDPPDDGEVAAAFVEGVLGAREVLDAFEESSGSVDDAFAVVEPLVPRWERERTADWEATWRERTERLCEWAAAFGLVERVDEGYRATERK